MAPADLLTVAPTTPRRSAGTLMFDGAASALLRHDREAVTAANSMRVLSLGLLRSEQAASDSIATRAAFRELQRLHDWAVSLCELPASTRPGRPLRGDTEKALDESCAAAMRGERSTRSMLALERENADAARLGWQRILEEPCSASEAADVWQAVLSKHSGVLRTACGVLVASLTHATTTSVGQRCEWLPCLQLSSTSPL